MLIEQEIPTPLSRAEALQRAVDLLACSGFRPTSRCAACGERPVGLPIVQAIACPRCGVDVALLLSNEPATPGGSRSRVGPPVLACVTYQRGLVSFAATFPGQIEIDAARRADLLALARRFARGLGLTRPRDPVAGPS